jgi:diaminobutyrate-2-oxoglutarate transaminase
MHATTTSTTAPLAGPHLAAPASHVARRGHSPAAPVSMSNAQAAARQDARESNARTYARKLRLCIVRGQGVRVTDADGRQYIDCLAAAGTLVLGHNHAEVNAAVKQAIDDGIAWQTLDIATPAKDAFTQALFDSLPSRFAQRARIQFCSPSGSDAIEAALKLTKTATGRSTVLAFAGGYHGMTQGALALMGNLGPKQLPGLPSGAQFLPYPYAYRCPFEAGGEHTARLSAAMLRTLLADVESGVLPAAAVMELVQGEGGVIPAPDAWVREVRALLQAHHVPMVVDEVQSGWGRTGKLYAFEHSGIEPDVLVLSKAIGGGLPLAVIVYDQALDVWKPGAHAGTFRGNQLAMVAGLATLKVLREQHIPEHAARMGERLRGHLKSIATDMPCIGDVRGRGLMLGAELVDPDGPIDALSHPLPDGALAKRVQQECLARGLIIEMGGRHGSVARFLSPLIVTAADVDAIASIFRDALVAAVAQKSAAEMVA